MKEPSILLELMLRVGNGERFVVNLEDRYIKLGKKYLVKKGGVYDEERELGIEHCSLKQALEYLNNCYIWYKYSTPRQHRGHWKYFKPLSETEMTMEQLTVGCDREVAKAALEGATLLMMISGILYWDDEVMKGTYFYRGKDGFRLLKDWF